MVLCFAACCSHRSGREKCSFFTFPREAKRKALWTRLSRRADRDPGHDARLCSCHFADGKKENGPSIFSYSEEPRNTVRYHKRKQSLEVNTDDSSPQTTSIECEMTDNTEEINMPVVTNELRRRILDLQAENAQLKAEKERLQIVNSQNTQMQLEIDQMRNEIRKLKTDLIVKEAENTLLKQENEKLIHEKGKFLFKEISSNNELVSLFTGLPNAKVFFSLCKFIERLEFNYIYNWRVENLPLQEQVFITLQKLRRNYKFADLAVRYKVSDTLIRNIFFTILCVLHESLYDKIINLKNLPSLDKVKKIASVQNFPNCRFLIDTTEVYIKNPRKDLEAQRQTYSNYKKRQTLKSLVVVSPNGTICYTSKLYAGSISDKMIFEESCIAKFLNPGDMILADKGFLIHDLLPQGVSVNIPPFLTNAQFTEEEAKFTTQLARKRVHVERSIGRLKKFEILDLISNKYASYATKIFQVCALLVNLQNPIIKQ